MKNTIDKYVLSSDGIQIHYAETGEHPIALVFVHGWLGNTHWWDHQQQFFNSKYKIVQIDLGGHGLSGKSRQQWSSRQYADDITAVIRELHYQELILIGHSMAGAFVLEAALNLPHLKAIVLVDTLKDLDQVFTNEQAETFLYSHYRTDFKAAVENLLPQFLFADGTPAPVKHQLQTEFLQNSPEHAISALEPLYKMDVQTAAKKITVPVRAINSDATPASPENNRKYFADYDVVFIKGTGHYPMLEKPDVFNKLLDTLLDGLRN